MDGHGTAGTATSGEAYQAAKKFVIARGLSYATIKQFPVKSDTAYFRDLGGEYPALKFLYPGGWQARSLPPQEKAFTAQPGWKPTFWNLENVLRDAPSTVFITEGQIDAMSICEAGMPSNQIISVPNGASKSQEFVCHALQAGLNKVKRFIWCGDNDPPGLELRAFMIKTLGAARFKYVDWPEGCKDANDALRQGSLWECLLHAKEWPQEGLYRLSDLPEPPKMTVWRPRMIQGDKVGVAPRCLSVFTGQPGHGKTVFSAQWWYEIIKDNDLAACVASFETRAKPHLRRILRSLHIGGDERTMSEEDKLKADSWIGDHYFFLVHSDERPTLDWFLECAETAVVRYGVKVVQLDPWNRLEAMRGPRETETEYIGKCLRELHVFAQDMNCHVQVIAHPSKMGSERRGSPPELEDISASKHWENMVDQGFGIYRPKLYEGGERRTETTFFHLKARYEELGYPCKLNLNYDLVSRKYISMEPYT